MHARHLKLTNACQSSNECEKDANHKLEILGTYFRMLSMCYKENAVVLFRIGPNGSVSSTRSRLRFVNTLVGHIFEIFCVSEGNN